MLFMKDELLLLMVNNFIDLSGEISVLHIAVYICDHSL